MGCGLFFTGLYLLLIGNVIMIVKLVVKTVFQQRGPYPNTLVLIDLQLSFFLLAIALHSQYIVSIWVSSQEGHGG